MRHTSLIQPTGSDIRHLAFPLDNPILAAEKPVASEVRVSLNANEFAYLSRTSCSLESIEEWVLVILERDMYKAVSKLEQIMSPDMANSTLTRKDYVPIMLVMLLLKRQAISSHALQKLLS